jgi:hypothetical protein
MADRVQSIHGANGNLDEQLEEVHQVLERLLVSMPTAKPPPVPARNPARSPTVEAPFPLSPNLRPSSPLATSPRKQNTVVSLPRPPRRSRTPEQSVSPEPTISIRPPSSPTETMSTSRASSPSQKRASEFSFGGSSYRYSSSSYASSTASSGTYSSSGTPRDSYVSRQPSTSNKRKPPLPGTPEVHEPGERKRVDALPLLPPPAMHYTARPGLERVSSQTTLTPYPTTQPDYVKLHRSSTTASQKVAFEKEAFRNSAVLCDSYVLKYCS